MHEEVRGDMMTDSTVGDYGGFMFRLNCASRLAETELIIARYEMPVTFTEVKHQSCGRGRVSG